jgi:hypothetical protein
MQQPRSRITLIRSAQPLLITTVPVALGTGMFATDVSLRLSLPKGQPKRRVAHQHVQLLRATAPPITFSLTLTSVNPISTAFIAHHFNSVRNAG